MTRDEILNMPAGREMDALIAERVMGRDVLLGSDWYFPSPYGFGGHKSVPHYSTDIGNAWEVVDEMQAARNYWAYTGSLSSYCYAMFAGHQSQHEYRAEADKMPLAICRAALLAVMEEE